jgi:hypothetical protein
MPLYEGSIAAIRAQLESIQRGEAVKVIEVGRLTDEQFSELCRRKAQLGHPIPGSPFLVYKGKHHYDSRVVRDGYAIADLVLQIEAALSADSTIVIEKHMTAVVSAHPRDDGYGCWVTDRVILELQSRKPKAEVYSAIPKGDNGGPRKHKGPAGAFVVNSAPRITVTSGGSL